MGALDDLLVLQALDTRTDQLRHQRDHLPERAERAALLDSAAAAEAAVAPTRRALDAVRAREAALEAEAGSAEERAAEIGRRLYDGSVVAHKDLEAMQEEQRHLTERQRALEDDAIAAMEEAEPLLAVLAAHDAEQAGRRSAVEALDARITVAEAEVDAELDTVTADRAAAAATLPAAVLEAYDALRRRLGGTGAARLVGARCEGCHLEIPSAQLEAVRRAPDDELVTCPECGRILVR